MPEYTFEDLDATGDQPKRREIFYPMSEAPSIGSIVVVEGHRMKRLTSDSLVNTNPLTSRYPIASNSLPRWMPGAKHDKKGRPIVASRSHADRICKTHGYDML